MSPPRRNPPPRPSEPRTCSQCAHATDYHELNYRGEPFLCRCQFHRWSRFLYAEHDVCEHYRKRAK